MKVSDVRMIYEGSNGEATTALYRRLEALGPVGVIAVNLFRACKASERAKLYRGGAGFKPKRRSKYSGMAYDKKDWSIGNLADMLLKHGAEVSDVLCWGWALDPGTERYHNVLYIDLPTGQASFHTSSRRAGPDYTKGWAKTQGKGTAEVIIGWVGGLVAEHDAAQLRSQKAASTDPARLERLAEEIEHG